MKLSAKYATTLLTLIFCVVLSFAGIIIFQFRSEIAALNSRSAAALGDSVMKEIEEKEVFSTRVLAAALTNPLYQIDMLKINELIEAVRRQPNVRYVYVYDDKRRIIHDGTKALSLYNKVLDDDLTVTSMRLAKTGTLREKNVLHVATPINLHEEVVGGVRIGFALNRILSDIARQQDVLDANYRDAAKKQLYFIGIIALTFSFCGLVASVALARSWSKPIIFLSRLTPRIGKGDYDITIPFDRSDEIGALARGFRQMVQSLKSHRQKEVAQSEALREANGQLQLANDFLKNEITERERAQEEVSRQHERISSLHDIGAAINATLEQKLLLDAFFAKIESILPCSAVSICLHDPATGRLAGTAQRNLVAPLWGHEGQTTQESPALRISEMLIARNDPLVIEDLSIEPRPALFEPLWKEGWRAFVGLPLTAEGKVIGGLAFYLRQSREFPKEEVAFLATLAGQVALAISNAQLYEHSRCQAAELEKANKAKDEFLNVMSHELRTPLSVIRGYAQLMSIGFVGDTNPQQNEITEKIIVQSNELLRMINEILQVGSLQSGKVQGHFESTNLNDLATSLKITFEALARKTIALNWDIPPAIPTVKTDGDKLKHVLQNLIHNAIKFTDDGSVTVSVRWHPQSVEFQVKDTGVGIEKEMLPVIFDIFRQVDGSQTRSHGGVGVGLFIVKKYVELLNGKIEVQSTPGRGTTFTLTIPADDSAQSPAPSFQEPLARLTA